jgi:hydroxyacylglutathione hydrolase
MFLRMVYDEKLAQAAYLIGCQKTGEAIVFDPERDVDRYLALAAREGLKIVAVAETHIHADFVSGARELAEHGAIVYVSDEGDADWKYQWLGQKSGGGEYKHRLLKDGDTFTVGNIEFKAVHTPGHTPEHVCYLVTDRGAGAAEPMGIITGDFVFVGDLGRPDLLETAAGFMGSADASARRLFASVQKFKSMPEYLQVWPAHGAGSACGKALGAVPQSTVGYEKRFSPAIAASANEASFIKFILDGQPEPPLYFARMKRDNKAGPRILGTAKGIAKPAEMTPAQVAALDARRVAIIDTRGWDAFRKGHVPGSLFHPVNNSFNTDAGSMVADGEEVVLIIDSGRLDEALRDLMRVGIDRVIGWMPAAGVEEVGRIKGGLATTAEVDVNELAARTNDPSVMVLDVRRAAEYAQGHIAGAACVAHTRLAAKAQSLPKGKKILIHCRSGGRSARACALLQREGYDVANVAGGFLAWEKSGLAVER